MKLLMENWREYLDEDNREEFKRRLAQMDAEARAHGERSEQWRQAEKEIVMQFHKSQGQIPLETIRTQLEGTGMPAEEIEYTLERLKADKRELDRLDGPTARVGCRPGGRYNAMTGEKCPDETAGCPPNANFNALTGKPCK